MEDEKIPQEEKISEKLDIPFTPHGEIVKTVSPDVAAIQAGKVINDLDLKKDYLTVRTNLRDIIMSGSSAIDSILEVAKESDNPRAYEVLGQLIKAVSDANKDLLEIHHKVKVIEDSDGSPKTNTNITNNTMFVGSTKDLQDIMKQKYKEMMQEMMQSKQIIESESKPIEDEDKNA